MQGKKRYGGRERSNDEGQGRSQEESNDRQVSKMRDKDVSDYGKGLVSDFFGSNRSPKLFFTKIILGCLVFLNIVAWFIVWDLAQPKFLEVVFFDVGQGDATFIETPQRIQILIDGGPSSVILEKLAKEMPFYDRTIDLIILTHPEKDHLFGLLEVLKKYKIKNILWTGVVKDTAEFQEWRNLINKEGAKIIMAQAGQQIDIGLAQGGPILLDILNPSEDLEGQEFKDSNDTSIVADLVFKDVSFLFTGDITEKVEKKLNVDSDILKVAHHGSKTSSSPEFLKKVSPDIAIISVGENKYGHPSPEVLANLENFGIKTLITKELGDIKIISDGEKYGISNSKNQN